MGKWRGGQHRRPNIGVTAAPNTEVTAAEVATAFVTAAAVTAAPMMMTKMAHAPDDDIGLYP